eukprot:11176186-Lingulodinium_polyedra.AAC.1
MVINMLFYTYRLVSFSTLARAQSCGSTALSASSRQPPARRSFAAQSSSIVLASAVSEFTWPRQFRV